MKRRAGKFSGSPTRANQGEREAERLRRHNEEFRYALAHNVTLIEARRRLAQLRFAELEERVHPPLKPPIARCGTEIPQAHQCPPSGTRQHYWWEDR